MDPVKLETDKLVDIALSMSMRPVSSHAFDTKVLLALEDRARFKFHEHFELLFVL